MKRIALIGLLLLAACATPEQREAARIAQEIEDIKECQKLGFKQGTDAFADCRLRLVEMRQAAYNASRIQTSVGFGYGWPRSRYFH